MIISMINDSDEYIKEELDCLDNHGTAVLLEE